MLLSGLPRCRRMAPLKKRRKANSRRWSRAVRDRPRRALDRAVSNDYTYDLNAAGYVYHSEYPESSKLRCYQCCSGCVAVYREPMLSWAQAQQTVRLMRGHSTERFTIANELPLKYETSSTSVPREITKPAKKKIATALLSAAGSFELVEALQKPVENVVAPPDNQQESYVCDEEVRPSNNATRSCNGALMSLCCTGHRNAKDHHRKRATGRT